MFVLDAIFGGGGGVIVINTCPPIRHSEAKRKNLHADSGRRSFANVQDDTLYFMINEKDDETIELIDEQEAKAPDLAKRIASLRGDLKVCDEEKKQYLDGWQRAKADFINYKNDEGKRLEDLGRFITQGVLQDLLPVLDSFDLALRSVGGNNTAGGGQLEQGVLMIRSQMMDVLKKRGISQITVEAGEPFNPEKHESIGEIESQHPAGSIAEEVQKGYMLAGRVIRPARVRLGKS